MRKQSGERTRRFELLLLALTVTVSAFTVGYYLGRNTSRPLREQTGAASIYLERQPDLPAPVLPEEKQDEIEQPPQSDCLDLNTATEEDLTSLPGIGEELAERIVAYREQYGPFVSVEELTQVRGIGEKKLQALRDLVKVEGKDENSSGG